MRTVILKARRNQPATAEPDQRRPLTYTVDEAAALLGVSRSHAYSCVNTGEIPSVRLRRRILIPSAAIADLLASPAHH